MVKMRALDWVQQNDTAPSTPTYHDARDGGDGGPDREDDWDFQPALAGMHLQTLILTLIPDPTLTLHTTLILTLTLTLIAMTTGTSNPL